MWKIYLKIYLRTQSLLFISFPIFWIIKTCCQIWNIIELLTFTCRKRGKVLCAPNWGTEVSQASGSVRGHLAGPTRTDNADPIGRGSSQHTPAWANSTKLTCPLSLPTHRKAWCKVHATELSTTSERGGTPSDWRLIFCHPMGSGQGGSETKVQV